MKKISFLFATAALCMLLFSVSSQAQTFEWVGAGSSALFNGMGLAAEANPSACNLFNDAESWSYANAVDIIDNRAGAGKIPNQKGNVIIVFDPHLSPTRVCVYVSVDSVVGNRSALATDSSGNPDYIEWDSGVPCGSSTVPAGQNLIPYLPYGADVGAGNSTLYAICTALQSPVYIQFAGSDIRPEDAAEATYRVLSGYQTSLQPNGTILWGPNLSGLGYCTAPSVGPVQSGTLCPSGSTTNGSVPGLGEAILSVDATPKKAYPVSYSIFGNDPISGHAVGAHFTLNVGLGPVVFFYNNSVTSPVGHLGSGHFNNINSPALAKLYDGTFTLSSQLVADPALPGNGQPVIAYQREPLSGTMNVTEFSVFATDQSQTSQETNVKPVTAGGTDNPLNQTVRKRAVGTSDEVSLVSATADSIGYAFWGYGNFATGYPPVEYTHLSYATLDGLEPFLTNGTNPHGAGVFPVYNDTQCGSGYTCSAALFPILPFTNLYDGSYTAWTTYRLVGNSQANLSQLQQIITAIQSQSTVYSDLLPMTSAYAEHDHFYQDQTGGFSCNDATNGATSLAGGAGGDVGGLVFPVQDLGGTGAGAENTCPTETIRNLHK